ncbi:hypothetical protein NDN08_000967 [Rhodosorus marinus]|uniref:BCNT-C domain-containing protein n=1 Tax=Rhodosorus marinus TaxID=101924 RepID=A0AAV8UR07_9RHOD|nr:hypothetical protein NDN08_000967 [Rhodosorus marinus]
MKSSHGDDGGDEASMSSDDEEYDPGKDPDAGTSDQDGKPDSREKKVARKNGKPKGKGLLLEEDVDETAQETTNVVGTKTGSSPPKEKINEGKVEGALGVVDNANGEQPQESSAKDGDKPSKSETPKRTAIDDIWASMNKPIPVKKKKKAPVAFDSSWISQPSAVSQTAAPKPGSLDILTDSVSTKPSTDPKQPKQNLDDAHPKPAASKGLEGIVADLSSRKASVMDRSKSDWKEFKESNKLQDELEAHKKDKNRFTDRVAFLDRVDVREWKAEQERKRRR